MSEALARARGLAFWRGPVSPVPLEGGITNTNFLVEDQGRRCVVRVGEDIPVHGVLRARELAASRAAHAAGVSPAVLHAEPGILVLDFIEGRTLRPQDVAGELDRIVPLLKRVHREIRHHLRGPAQAFWVFHVIRDYAHTLRDGRHRLRASLPRWLEANSRLEDAVGAVEIVYAHNDLLAANLIDDGRRLWLVDWDYAGFNSPLFDLGGLASNNGLDDAQRERLLEAYYDRPVTDGLRREFQAMLTASLLREALWSMVSELHSTIEFDYVAYTAENLGSSTPGAPSRPWTIDGDALMAELPTRSAKVVIVGGGIIGCSLAYHLGKMGWRDVLLLERAQLTSGSTWHAAGLVGQLRTNANITRLLGYSVELYDRLEAETGQATGWKRCGGLRLACNPDRWTEVRRQATTATSFGLEMQLLSAREAKELWPLMTVEDVVGAAFLPSDGQASPSDITQALAKGARAAGVTIMENVAVTGIETEGGRVRAVVTGEGRIACERLVICAGLWSRALGQLAGVTIPLAPVRHQYVVTEPIEGVTPGLPTLRDPDRLTYYKEEVGGLVMGGYEPNPVPWATAGIPEGFSFELLDDDWDHFLPLMELALPRVPALERAGIKQMINGPESFTPDGNFILGEAPGVRGLFVGCGFNAFGIASAGGAGMALAEWVARGNPPYDLWPVDIRRFGRNHVSEGWVRERTLEAYAKHYTIAWPAEEFASGRPLRRSPLYERLRHKGAVFGEKLGWERPNWFAVAGQEGVDRYAFGRPNWFEAVGREHRACREGAALFDQTSFAKFLLVGRDAQRALGWICANDIGKPPGSLTYTQMLNDEGGIECDLTVVRLASDRFYIVTGTGFATHDHDWIARNLPKDADAQLVDVTSTNAVLSLFGPKAREVLASCTDADLANAAFPFASCRTIAVAGAPVLALRVTYVGELGWELHVPVEFALTVYDALMAAGAAHGLVDAGYRAIESLRLEKGYRAWGAEIGPDHSPLVAGLGWATKLKRDIPFKGRDALLRQQAQPLPRLLAGFTTPDPEVTLLGRETIYRDGRPVGWLASGGWGYTLNTNIGYGYVRDPNGVTADFVLSGTYELDVAGRRIPAEPFLKPPYDPAMARIKA